MFTCTFATASHHSVFLPTQVVLPKALQLCLMSVLHVPTSSLDCKYVINVVDTRVFALLNISLIVQSTMSHDTPFGELLNLNYVSPAAAIHTIERNRNVILDLKVRLSKNIAGQNDLKVLGLAKEAAAAIKLPLMVHIGDSHSPVEKILELLGNGDVLTHTFHGRERGILDAKGRVIPAVRKAVDRGVRLDVGHGAGSFSFDVCEKALKQDVIPGTISSDLHQYNVHGSMFDLATTLSKFMHLSLTLDQISTPPPTRPTHSASLKAWERCARAPKPTLRCSRRSKATSSSSTR